MSLTLDALKKLQQSGKFQTDVQRILERRLATDEQVVAKKVDTEGVVQQQDTVPDQAIDEQVDAAPVDVAPVDVDEISGDALVAATDLQTCAEAERNADLEPASDTDPVASDDANACGKLEPLESTLVCDPGAIHAPDQVEEVSKSAPRSADDGISRDLAASDGPTESSALEAADPVMPTDDVASSATLMVESLEDMVQFGGEVPADVPDEPSTFQPDAVAEIQADETADESRTLPAYLLGLRPEAEPLDAADDDELIMDTQFFGDEDAYNPVIRPIDGFDDDPEEELRAEAKEPQFDDGSLESVEKVSEATSNCPDVTSGNSTAESDVWGNDNAEFSPDVTAPIPSGSFRESLVPLDEASEPPLHPPGQLPPPSSWRGGADSERADSPTNDRPDRDAVAYPPQPHVPEALERPELAGDVAERESEAGPAGQLPPLGDWPSPHDSGSPQTAALPDDTPAEYGQLETPEVTTATTDYEQSVLGELADSRKERLYLELIERIRQESGLRLPGNLIATSPVSTPRTADILTRLAYLMSQGSGEDLLLVDANPVSNISCQFEMAEHAGISNALAGENKPLDIVRVTSRDHLNVVPFGTQGNTIPFDDPIVNERIEDLMRTWTRHYHRVLIDVGETDSPLLQLFGPYAGDAILVVPFGTQSYESMTAARIRLGEAAVRVLGCCVTDEPDVEPSVLALH